MEPVTKQVAFRVTEETLEAAQKIAEKEERRLSDVLRRLLLRGLERYSVRKAEVKP